MSEIVFLLCNSGSAQMTEEMDKTFTSTAQLKNEGGNSDLLSGKGPLLGTYNRISLRSGANYAHLSIVKSEAKGGVNAGQMFNC